MQDSSNRGWDAQFVDTAWGEMRQLLDQELPVSAGEGKRRRAVLFAAFFFLGLILGGLAIYMTDSPGIGFFPVPDRAVALELDSRQPASDAQVSVSDAETNTVREVIKENAQANGLPVDGNRIVTPREPADGHKGATPIMPLLTKNDEIKNIPLVVDTSLHRVNTSPPLEVAFKPTEEPSPVTETLSEGTELPTLEDLMLLPTNELERLLMEDEQDPGGFPLPPVIASAAGTRLNWGAELGANYYQTPGYFGGLLVDYRLSDRWGVQSGLRYGQLSSGLDQPRGAAQEESFSRADQTSQQDPTTGLNTNLDNQAEKISAPVDYYDVTIKLQHVGVPVLVNYQLGRKWKLGAGIQAHYLLAARRPVKNSTQDKTYAAQVSVSSFQRELTGLTDSDNRIDAQFLQRWNIGASLGAGFQPAERWSFQLQYQYGVFNWLGNDRFFLSPTGLQLSAVYQLNR